MAILKPKATDVGHAASLSAAPERAAAPAPADGGQAGSMSHEVQPGQLRIRLREGAKQSSFLDPQTHLRVTAEWQTVDAKRVGEPCRRSSAVEIEPFDGAQDRKA